MSWNGCFLLLSLFVAVETGTFEIVFKDILFLDALLGFHLLFSEMSKGKVPDFSKHAEETLCLSLTS